MELKWRCLIRLKLFRRVLIVPLWNWNHADIEIVDEVSLVLIVPLWNWNLFDTIDVCWSLFCSNCTFMELKFHQIGKVDVLLQVLIVPLWNWNWHNVVVGLLEVCSNCTFMELKLLRRDSGIRRHLVLIVPLWNWNRKNEPRH